MIYDGTSDNTAARRHRRLSVSLWFALVLAIVPIAAQAAEQVFYRYVNDKGVKVLHHSIPPKYAQRGYEVVSLSGRVIKVVPPALTDEQKGRLEERRRTAEALAKWDKQLRRRYSSVTDIEAAKQRKLSDLDANISILRGNINNLTKQMQEQQSKAADIERAGRDIPESLLGVIGDLQIEVTDTEEQVQLRLQEREAVADKFDRDKERFREISGG